MNATYDQSNAGSDVQLVLKPCDISVEEIDESVAPKDCIVMRGRDNGWANLIKALQSGAVSFVNPRLGTFSELYV